MKINKNEINAKTAEEVREQVESLLRSYDYIVVEDKAAAEKFFEENFGKSEVYSRIEQTFDVDGEVVLDYQNTLKVTIRSYYQDPGSADYVYSVDVVEY